MENAIKINGITKKYKGFTLGPINLEIPCGFSTALIGANGAGKTTTMQSVVGLIPKKSGVVTFDGQDITKTPCHKIVHLGMTQVPEGRRIFQELSVYENLLMGAYSMKKGQADFKKDIEMVYERFPRLAERKNQIAGTLSGGEQQMLAIGRALMSHPKLLMLDEPSMGLSPLLVDEVFKIIKDINKDGTTILFVEQNSKIALNTADRGYVLQTGEMVMNGKCEDLLNDEGVKAAYLGAG
jgi:branched-chain amino acid transport system ATP-binding protein